MMLKRYLSLALLVSTCFFSLFGQEIKIHEDRVSEKEKSHTGKEYTGLNPYLCFPCVSVNKHYYDGQRIHIIPQESKVSYLDGLTYLEARPIDSAADTVWNRNHTKIKRITIPNISVYKSVPKRDNEPVWDYLALGGYYQIGNRGVKSGYFTPSSVFWGHSFIIDSCVVTHKPFDSRSMTGGDDFFAFYFNG